MLYHHAELYNVAELVKPEAGHGLNFCRIPDALRRKLNKDVALCPTGCEIRFNLQGPEARIVLQRYARNRPPEIAEVYQGCFFHTREVITDQPTEIRISLPKNIAVLEKISRRQKLPFDARLTRVILPYVSQPRLLALEGKITPPARRQIPARRYLCYGSSISHGCTALRPTGTFAMRVAQRLGVDLINLGMASAGTFEPELAGYIAGRKDWDFMSVEMANIFGRPDFRERVERFLRILVKSRPQQWIFCIGLIRFTNDFAEMQDVVPGLLPADKYRKILRDLVKTIRHPRLVYVDGRSLLNEVGGLSADLLHPAPAGMEEIAVNFSRLIRKTLPQEILGS